MIMEYKRAVKPECFGNIDPKSIECNNCFIEPMCGMASCFRRSREISEKYG